MTDSSDNPASEPPSSRTALIVLAAGAGTRMKSDLAKPLHQGAGLSMVEHVLAAGAALEPDVTVLVAGEQTRSIPDVINRPDIQVVIQDPPQGTGQAVRLALEAVPDCTRCVVLYADHPLLTGEIISRLAAALDQPGVRVAVLTMPANASDGYGRIDRDGDRVMRIVERKDEAAPRTEPFEANSGMMALDARWALSRLQALPPSPVTGEWYVTDLVEEAVRDASAVDQWPVVTVGGDERDLMGVNDRVELAEAERRLLARIHREQMLAGVTIRLPETVTIESGVTIGRDTVIEPGSIIRRGTTIGERCVIGPNTLLEEARLGNDVRVVSSTIEKASVGDRSDVGPYAHLRNGADIAADVHIGNYVEIKNSRLSSGVRAGHVSYLGDATIGAGTNIGAGTVTANYDGARKHPTRIGENVFIGSDTMLVAPVTIGDGAKTAAGSVVTRDVPPGQLVMGVPARPKQPAPSGQRESGEQNG